MSQKDLEKVVISNARWGDLDNAVVYLTKSLAEEIKKQKTRTGESRFEALKTGRAFQGFKHLIELTRQIGPKSKLVLTNGPTEKVGEDFYISLKNYSGSTRSSFLSLYRKTGLEGATAYLKNNFPDDAKDLPEVELTTSDMTKVKKDFPRVIESLTKTAKHKRQLVKHATEVVRGLKDQKRVLKEDIEALRRLKQESNITYYQQKIDELAQRLNKDYPETKGKNSWQSWIYENNWIFGVQYQKPIEKQKVGFDNIPDYLFPSLDGFLDILEIKKPSHDAIKADPSHAGSYIWDTEANKGLGQIVNYIYQIELHQFELKQKIEREYADLYDGEIFTIRPRGFLLIGKSDQWKPAEKEAFRKLNHSLHGIEVMTYTDLLQRGKKIIEMYSDSL